MSNSRNNSKKTKVNKSFLETGKEVSQIRQGMVDYCKKSKEPQVKKMYKMNYFDGDTYFGLKYDSFVIEANSKLEAIIKFKDYFNSNLKVSHPFDHFKDDTLIDIASQYGDENDDEIFKSKDIDKIMEEYIENAFSNDSLWFVEYDAPKVIGKSNMNASEAAQAVVLFLTTFLQSQEVDRKGKINLEQLVASFQEKQEELTTVLDPFIPVVEKEKKERKPREKKLKDENAPKRPTTGYMLYCKYARTEIKEANPGKKMTEISKILGATWKELSEEDKKPYTKKASKDKKRYDREMKDYVRPSDEDLLEQKVNQKKSRKSKSSGEKSKRKKKDKNAPKNPISSYLYFAMEKRSEVKESNPDMTATQITKELGRMWKEDFSEEEDRKKWVKLAKKDKQRYTEEKEKWDEENSQKEQSNGEEKESAVKKKEKRSRAEENDDENQEENDDENQIVESVKSSPVKPKRKLPSFIPQ